MPLDPKKLRSDAKRLQQARLAAPGRETIGTTSAVRAALPIIYELRNDGVAWSAIADALAKQGVVQGKDRVPITTHRLTALVNQIESQDRRRSEKNARPRGDTVATIEVERVKPRLLQDAVALSSSSTPVEPAASEHDLRAAAFEKLQSILKKE
ncbi:hypothetical protein [Tardiphaga sp.]|jgi:hypothetical protein|uniref:hypothetical protein n=1 Tax=Tardiphaga sp. TaxID=1926292 RepID=UPI0037D9A3C8